jgi:kynurenine formamidase
MKNIDLTHYIEEGMPVYPGTKPPSITIATTIRREGFEERLLTMFSHTGTHMDAPSHIISGGKKLSDYDISDFTGRAALLDVRGMRAVTGDFIFSRARKLASCKFAVLYTGWDRYWGSTDYFRGYPVLEADAAKMLTECGLKAVCMDTISIDPSDTRTYDNHKIVFSAGLYVVENLTNLHRIGSDIFTLTCLPMNIKDGDGAPVRAFASV